MDAFEETDDFSASLQFLKRWRHLFDFKLTEFFTLKPYENIPPVWLEYMQSNLVLEDTSDVKQKKKADSIDSLLCGLFRSTETMPADLKDFLRKAAQFSLPREPWESDSPLPDIPLCSSRGLSPKKSHEITRLAAFLNELAQREAKTDGKTAEDVVFVDVGSGLGYLGEILCSYGYSVINVESEQSHCDGAKRRQGKNASTTISTTKTININATLADDVSSVSSFNSQIRDCISGRLSFASADSAIVILTGLHACGDLTPTMLKVFSESFSDSSVVRYRAIVVVGCCYHRMTTSTDPTKDASTSFRQFPISSSLSSALSNLDDDDSRSDRGKEIVDGAIRPGFLSSFALRLAAQETLSRWRRQNAVDHDLHAHHVGFRAVLEAALDKMKDTRKNIVKDNKSVGNLVDNDVRGESPDLGGIVKLHKKLVSGKNASFVDFGTYKATLMERVSIVAPRSENGAADLHLQESLSRFLDDCYADLETEIDYVEPFTFLQYWLQGVLESLILKDRAAFLRNKGLKCRLLPLFEDHVSPRNVAIVGFQS